MINDAGDTGRGRVPPGSCTRPREGRIEPEAPEGRCIQEASGLASKGINNKMNNNNSDNSCSYFAPSEAVSPRR